MSNLGEEAEIFFRRGDEGTYEGGPASVIPFAVCDELAEDLTIGVTEEQLERRRRFKHVVATIVGALGAGLLFLSAWLLAASARATEGESSIASSASPQHAMNAVPAPAVQSGFAHSSPAITTASTEPATVDQPVARAGSEAVRKENAVVPRPSVSSVANTRRNAGALPKRSVAPIHASVGLTSPLLHSPPTANFPD